MAQKSLIGIFCFGQTGWKWVVNGKSRVDVSRSSFFLL